MQFLRISLVLLAALTFSLPATAQTGSEVLTRCLAAKNVLDGRTAAQDESNLAMWCIGYLSGMVDGIVTMTGQLSNKRICIPSNGLSSQQSVIKVVTDWLISNPKYHAESGRSAVVIAFGTAFPCP